MDTFTVRDRLVVGSMCTATWTLEQDLKLYRDLGLTTVNLSTEKLRAVPGDAWKTMIARSGLSVDTLLMRGIGFDLSRSESWPSTREHLAAAMQVAAELGARRCMFCGGSGHGIGGDEAAARFDEAMEPILGMPDELGIQLVLEPVRPQFAHLGFVHTIRDAVPIARRLRMGLVLDVVHVWWESKLEETLAANSDVIGLVQLADLYFSQPILERVSPGDGELPLSTIIGWLLSAGYLGLFEVELIGSAFEREGYKEAVVRALRFLGDLNIPHTPRADNQKLGA